MSHKFRLGVIPRSCCASRFSRIFGTGIRLSSIGGQTSVYIVFIQLILKAYLFSDPYRYCRSLLRLNSFYIVTDTSVTMHYLSLGKNCTKVLKLSRVHTDWWEKEQWQQIHSRPLQAKKFELSSAFTLQATAPLPETILYWELSEMLVGMVGSRTWGHDVVNIW